MKDVPKKHLPEVSGGAYTDGSCIPDPFSPPIIGEPDYPPRPGIPIIDLPCPYVDPTDLT